MNTKMKVSISILIAASVVALTGCGDKKEAASPTPTPTGTSSVTTQPTSTPNAGASASSTPVSQATSSPGASAKPGASPSGKPAATPTPAGTKGDAVQVVANPASVTVLVNKQNALPSSYEPNDLVYPNVPFTFKEKIEKRKMRQVAATALEKLFAGAEKDGIHLAGVSAYRSYATQKSVFDRYVSKDGLEKAKTYSAVPGTSEHETGLAIDVSGSDGKCAAEDCFAGTKEAVWLEKHAHEYGFIIRYPKGKDAITGYQYEPWHLRYVGEDIAKTIQAKNETLEEYFRTLPVAK
ncbi:D-alanyl-D-alanine carboxypeptidase family protein [Paenibacillus ferrarius]|uniref:M15 family metallopeptidase n=1 Tax=Paenibacillus ferrarius TaxID=1469647 RepID=UPI003D2D58B3